MGIESLYFVVPAYIVIYVLSFKYLRHDRFGVEIEFFGRLLASLVITATFGSIAVAFFLVVIYNTDIYFWGKIISILATVVGVAFSVGYIIKKVESRKNGN